MRFGEPGYCCYAIETTLHVGASVVVCYLDQVQGAGVQRGCGVLGGEPILFIAVNLYLNSSLLESIVCVLQAIGGRKKASRTLT